MQLELKEEGYKLTSLNFLPRVEHSDSTPPTSGTTFTADFVDSFDSLTQVRSTLLFWLLSPYKRSGDL